MKTLSVVAALAVSALFLQAADAGGDYKGTWSGGNGGGDLHLTLKPAGSEWDATVVFTLDSTAIPTTVTSVKVEGSKITIVFQYEIQGQKLQSSLKGEWVDGALAGKYESTSVGDGSAVDSGTWKASKG